MIKLSSGTGRRVPAGDVLHASTPTRKKNRLLEREVGAMAEQGEEGAWRAEGVEGSEERRKQQKRRVRRDRWERGEHRARSFLGTESGP